MRILHLHHFPLGESAAGRMVVEWAGALAAEGHDARILLVDEHSRDAQPLVADRMVCAADDPAADLAFVLPRFGADTAARGGATFGQLTDSQLAAYRDTLRRRLDVQIDRFNPDVLHVQHVWVFAQLAVETGVPYVVNAWGEELADCRADARYMALADQAAANASRILVPDAAMLGEAAELFELFDGPFVLLPDALKLPASAMTPNWQRGAAAALLRVYEAVLDERRHGMA
jgi:glycogen(starch) synthase